MNEFHIELSEHPMYKRFGNQGFQLFIGDDHGGYRIFGPKYDGSSRSLYKHRLTSRDIQEIRKYLDEAEKAIAP